MRHSFKLKKKELRELFKSKLSIQNVSIEGKDDVSNSIEMIINLLELEEVLKPVECRYDFLNNLVYFNLELLEGHSKKDFIEAIRSFDNFIRMESLA